MFMTISGKISSLGYFGHCTTNKLESIKDGLSIGILGISVVFIGLLTLFFSMKIFIYISNYPKNKAEKQKNGLRVTGEKGDEPVTGEIITAISMAIHQSREEWHDLEKTIVTLQRITRPYSPWSSKIHGLRRQVR